MKPTALLAPALLLVATSALCAAIAQKDGSESWTNAAGSVGARQETVLTRSRYHALRGVKLWDYDRRTCVIDVEQSSLNTASRSAAGIIRVCEPRASQAWKAADVGDGRYITAIDVCTANGTDAAPGIRGVRLWGSSIDGTTVEEPSADVKVEHFGCKRWRGKVSCPKGQIATGLRAHHGDQQTGIVGLELRCHELVLEGE